jgi:hypothetical protein
VHGSPSPANYSLHHSGKVQKVLRLDDIVALKCYISAALECYLFPCLMPTAMLTYDRLSSLGCATVENVTFPE